MAEETTQSTGKNQENVYAAEYLGSGTFKISKPKRNKKKTREARVHDGGKRARRHGH